MMLDDAYLLARELMEAHGVEWWGFRFDKAVRRFGVTKFRTQEITLSRQLTLLNDEDKVRDTILHEIAHVLAGPAAGHSLAWKLKAIEVGATPTRCYSAQDVNTVPPKLVAVCDVCGHVFRRHRRPRGARFCMKTRLCIRGSSYLVWKKEA